MGSTKKDVSQVPVLAKKRLVVLYQELSDLTAPKCASCRPEHSCCKPEFCHLTKEIAEDEWGVTLPVTSHPTLPFMGPSGCTVAPHLRPVCTAFVCERHYLNDTEFAEKYFDLRDAISDLSGGMV